MENVKFEVTPENIIPFCQVIAENDLTNEINGVSDDDENVLIEVSFNPKNRKHKKALVSLDELSEENDMEKEEEEEEEEDQD